MNNVKMPVKSCPLRDTILLGDSLEDQLAVLHGMNDPTVAGGVRTNERSLAAQAVQEAINHLYRDAKNHAKRHASSPDVPGAP